MTNAETIATAREIVAAFENRQGGIYPCEVDIAKLLFENAYAITRLLLARDAALAEARAKNDRLLAALREQVRHCGWCKGTTINLSTQKPCPACKPARDLIAEHNEDKP